MKLNLGCQIHYFDGWTNVDIVGDDPNIKVDVEANAIALPFPDESVDFIYAGHLLEHFYPDTAQQAVMEWRRVLKKGGKIVIVVPDCGEVMRDYASGRFKDIAFTWQQLYGRIYSYDAVSERHHIAFDIYKLAEMCGIQGFHGSMLNHPLWDSAEALNFLRPPQELEPFMDKHISRGAYQTGIVLTK